MSELALNPMQAGSEPYMQDGLEHKKGVDNVIWVKVPGSGRWIRKQEECMSPSTRKALAFGLLLAAGLITYGIVKFWLRAAEFDKMSSQARLAWRQTAEGEKMAGAMIGVTFGYLATLTALIFSVLLATDSLRARMRNPKEVAEAREKYKDTPYSQVPYIDLIFTKEERREKFTQQLEQPDTWPYYGLYSYDCLSEKEQLEINTLMNDYWQMKNYNTIPARRQPHAPASVAVTAAAVMSDGDFEAYNAACVKARVTQSEVEVAEPKTLAEHQQEVMAAIKAFAAKIKTTN